MKRRKGFTLVELVIVIAVIVILAAVLIPTFSGVIEKANNAKDFSLVSEMNKVLALEEATDGKNETIYEANLDLKKYGMDIEKLPSSKGYIYVWNSKENRVAALNKDYKLVFPQGEEIKDSNKENYFAVARTNEEVESLNEAKYSLYLTEDNTVTTVTINQGIDTGNNKNITTVNYNGNDTAKSVIIRTNTGLLTINAEKDSISHYGEATEVVVTAVANESYHEFGTSNTLKVTKGHILAENSAKIGDLVVTSEASSVKITNENKGSIENFVISETNKNVSITYNEKTGTLESLENDIVEKSNVVKPKEDVDGYGTVSNPYMVTSETMLKEMLETGKPVAVKLTNSFEFSANLVINSKVVIDLNGFTLSTSNNSKPIVVSENCELIINDSSSNSTGKISGINTSACDGYDTYLIKNYGSVIVNGGEISFVSEVINKYTYGIYVNGGTLTINDGIIKAIAQGNKSSSLHAVKVKGDNAKVELFGGFIYALNNADPSESSYGCASIYGVDVNGDGKFIMTDGEVLVEDLRGTKGYADKYGVDAKNISITGGKIVVKHDVADDKHSSYGIYISVSEDSSFIVENCEIYVSSTKNAYAFKFYGSPNSILKNIDLNKNHISNNDITLVASGERSIIEEKSNLCPVLKNNKSNYISDSDKNYVVSGCEIEIINK